MGIGHGATGGRPLHHDGVGSIRGPHGERSHLLHVHQLRVVGEVGAYLLTSAEDAGGAPDCEREFRSSVMRPQICHGIHVFGQHQVDHAAKNTLRRAGEDSSS
ncbi:hypothetical protein SFR_0064 [Streptomyces sp. FR-008]|nr:hypothetical protein SFR_0064 [Streptomyces sp. FR-008]